MRAEGGDGYSRPGLRQNHEVDFSIFFLCPADLGVPGGLGMGVRKVVGRARRRGGGPHFPKTPIAKGALIGTLKSSRLQGNQGKRAAKQDAKAVKTTKQDNELSEDCKILQAPLEELTKRL